MAYAGFMTAKDHSESPDLSSVTDETVSDDPRPDPSLEEFEPTSPPLIDDQGRVRLSFSRIDSYRNCPRRFRYAYIDRLPTVPSPHLSFGTSIHHALERFYDQKLPQLPPVEVLLDALYEGWEHEGFAELDRDEQLRFYRHAQQVLRRYHQRVADDFALPVTTEAWFEMPVGDVAVVVGSIDRVDRRSDGALHIVDYKTNRRAQDRQRVAQSLQLGIYALACQHLYGELPGSVALDFVVPGVQVAVGIDEIDLEGVTDTVVDVAAQVRAEAFEPTPNRLCDWCDFKAVCPAWHAPDGQAALGEIVQEAQRLRREVMRRVRELRELESGVARLRAELDATDGDGPGAP